MERSEPGGGIHGHAVGPEGGKEHVVLVSFVVSYHPLEHSFNDFVDNFYLPIALRVVG